MFALVDYIYDTSILNYVDKDKIKTGHSAGGLAAMRAAQYFGKLAKKIIQKARFISFCFGDVNGVAGERSKMLNLMLELVTHYMTREHGKMN